MKIFQLHPQIDYEFDTAKNVKDRIHLLIKEVIRLCRSHTLTELYRELWPTTSFNGRHIETLTLYGRYQATQQLARSMSKHESTSGPLSRTELADNPNGEADLDPYAWGFSRFAFHPHQVEKYRLRFAQHFPLDLR